MSGAAGASGAISAQQPIAEPGTGKITIPWFRYITDRARNGATGALGATGATGASGVNGIIGVDGSTGATGAAGANGATGPTGATGTAGATGTTGATGAGFSMTVTDGTHTVNNTQTLLVVGGTVSNPVGAEAEVIVTGTNNPFLLAMVVLSTRPALGSL